MSYKIVTDRLEVRSALDSKKPRYIVNGYALVPDKFDSYGYDKDAKGNIEKVRRSMFTKNCIDSIKKQSKFKKFFVDTKHQLYHDANIKSMIKGKVSPKEEKEIESFLEAKKLPIAKLNDITIDDKGLFIESELNPMFREVDADHKNYFDAIWYSLENKFLNGISINFIPTDVVQDKEGRDVINDVDIDGFSYVDRPSLPEHNIAEVAIRSAQDFVKESEGEDKMKEEKEKIEAEKVQLEKDKKEVADEKAKIEKEKEDKTKTEEEKKKEEVDKQAEELKKTKEELDAKNEELKKINDAKGEKDKELNSAKGVVKETPPPSQDTGKGEKGEEFYKENLKKITEEHDKTQEIIQKGQKPMIDNSMSGFAEMVNLQAKAGNLTADLDDKNAEYIRENRLLDRGKADLIAPRA